MSGLHGFTSWIDFVKATVSLGGMLTAGLWVILTFTLDGRYASADLGKTVAAAGVVVSEVQGQVAAVQGSVDDLKEVILAEQIFDTKTRVCVVTGRLAGI